MKLITALTTSLSICLVEGGFGRKDFATTARRVAEGKPSRINTFVSPARNGLRMMGEASTLAFERMLGGDDEAAYDEAAMENLADFSVKFQGCQWMYANGEEGNQVKKESYVRYRLCPSDTCDDFVTKGCTENYGDYVINAAQYMALQYEYQQNAQEQTCDRQQELCEENAYDDDDENACMKNNGYSYCLDLDEDDEDYDACDYILDLDELFDEDGACIEVNLENDDDKDVEGFFVGVHCAASGGEVKLAMYTDEECTIRSSQSFKQLTGCDMPFSESSIVKYDCMTCTEPSQNNDAGDDEEDEDLAVQFCEQIYELSGKCETNLNTKLGCAYAQAAAGDDDDEDEELPDCEGACDLIGTMKIVRSDGTYAIKMTKKGSTTAAIFIAVFATTFAGLLAYIFYMQSKTSATINLE